MEAGSGGAIPQVDISLIDIALPVLYIGGGALFFICLLYFFLVILPSASPPGPKHQLKEFITDLYEMWNGKPMHHTIEMGADEPAKSYRAVASTVALRSHSDFAACSEAAFFKTWIDSIEDFVVPSNRYFGAAAVLVKIYDQIRKDFADQKFIDHTTLLLSETPNAPAQDDLVQEFEVYQGIFQKNSNAMMLTEGDVMECMVFLKKYILYNLIIEDINNTKQHDYTKFIIS